MANELFEIIGIKQTKSKDGTRDYYAFSCIKDYSEYELENSECYGRTVEVVQANELFGCKVGDVVEFKYGKAIKTANGFYQPITGVFKLPPNK